LFAATRVTIGGRGPPYEANRASVGRAMPATFDETNRATVGRAMPPRSTRPIAHL